ncbi:ABC transporter permease subunit [Blastococcus brunescens]|uniref:ABC transporter permease subunit n=1 Tax=Blastococcus brunescens TaxID=1564165 RepID=A0ABZ1B7A4_9ACTN|nr:ABC transporter permease subunit [Blastococcus sp. BMG 8361]WRL64915.1 ABC transporter permease subunit [Blastococcus sp. BMG 8361]
MGRYVARRLLLTIPVMLGASILIFAMVYALPGDPIRALAGDRPLAPAVAAQLREEFNLNDPLWLQYVKYVGGLFQGDFGTDFAGRPVLETILDRLPVTAKLALVAILFEIVIGIVAGVLAGIRRNSFFDNLVLVSTTIVVSVPILVLAFLAQFVFGLKLELFPIAGVREGWYSYLLPGLVLAAGSVAYVARLTRTSMAENLRADYVRTARAKGLKPSTVVVRHTLRNSLIPVVTFIGADIGTLMGGAIVTETVFNIPGIGRAVFESIQRQEGRSSSGSSRSWSSSSSSSTWSSTCCTPSSTRGSAMTDGRLTDVGHDEVGAGRTTGVADPTDAETATVLQGSLWSDAWKALRKSVLFWLGALLGVVFILMAVFPQLFARGANPRDCDLVNSSNPPSAAHWFGFDQQGCDYLAQVVYGARNSLIIGVLAVLFILLLGVIVGAIAGFYGGFTDSLLSRLADIFYAMPLILGALVLLRVGPSTDIPIINDRGAGRSPSRSPPSAG